MSTISTSLETRDAAQLSGLARLARRLVLNRLKGLQVGQLVIQDGDESLRFGSTREGEIGASMRIVDSRAWTAILFGGSVGFGEAFVQGYWTTPDLVAVMRLAVRNMSTLSRVESGLARLGGVANRITHSLRRNTRSGAKRNISEHYDLGNDFFALFLDETLTYSCGIFEHSQSTLAEASRAKLDRICRKLDLGPNDHLLEIGTGWGSMAIHAARHYGARVTTTTISKEQWREARERVARAGLSERVNVQLKDYRDLRGSYTKAVSVEMIEAIGAQAYPAYFAHVCKLLKPDGLFLVQAITIADHAYDRARHSVDFIKRHIFPGSNIPSLTALCQAQAAASDFRLVQLEDLTPHYARTLRAWRERFLDASPKLDSKRYGSDFKRLWEYYLALCEGGFAERYLGDVQILYSRPLNRHVLALPTLNH